MSLIEVDSREEVIASGPPRSCRIKMGGLLFGRDLPRFGSTVGHIPELLPVRPFSILPLSSSARWVSTEQPTRLTCLVSRVLLVYS